MRTPSTETVVGMEVIVWRFRWCSASKVTREQYERMGAGLGKTASGPDAILIHVCGPTEDGWRIADVWESRGAFDRFAGRRLIPAMVSVGGPQHSKREVYETYHAGAVQEANTG